MNTSRPPTSPLQSAAARACPGVVARVPRQCRDARRGEQRDGQRHEEEAFETGARISSQAAADGKPAGEPVAAAIAAAGALPRESESAATP